MRHARSGVILAAVLVAAFVACTSGGETYSIVTDCIEDESNDAGCGEIGTSPYVCNNGALPSDSDPTLICNTSNPGANGSTIFCCSSTQTTTTCTNNSSIVCPGTAYGYECTSQNPPSNDNPDLECEPYGVGNATYEFCCFADAGATNVACVEGSDGGCTGGAFFYTCPPTSTPTATEPSLSCSSPTVLANGDVSYCCTN